ncbi:MAG: cobalamin-dependent protein [Rhodoferax sp.]|uniref:cobalamin-dependent protein n=1 Tax=Rhodoferax sp. TaxID=50421 RepID=UPI002635DD53|nr:cobalamin-dependent protein [Rhodoferax sp.]MDD2881574.1 cobalamin-dependent protein [Rhodoferax sp.]
MTQVNSESVAAHLSLADIEHCTGLSREVLRKWELRYQFPQPKRGARGQREYLAADVAKLKLISRLLDKGLRAGALVPQSAAQLQALLDARSSSHALPPEPSSEELSASVQALLEALAPDSDPGSVALFLQRSLTQHGLAAFVAYLMPAFNDAVGQAWLLQRLSIAAEHRYTDSVRQVVLRALPEPGHAHTRPRVLLTTPPGELHGLGLLALHAQLALQGADCIDLGVQTPWPEVLQSVHELQVGVVGISISACLAPPDIRHYVSSLLAGLPAGCELWVGGSGCAALTAADLAGCQVFGNTPQAVQRWLLLSKTQRGTPLIATN